MWIWTEDHSAMINLDHCLLLIIRQGETGYGVMAHVNRGDMGTLIKMSDTQEEAEKFVNSLGAASNGRSGMV